MDDVVMRGVCTHDHIPYILCIQGYFHSECVFDRTH
jgi:hypothetical protein